MSAEYKVGHKIGMYIHESEDKGWILYGTIKRQGSDEFIAIDGEDGDNIPFTEELKERVEKVSKEIADVITDAKIWFMMTLEEYETVGLEEEVDGDEEID